MDSILIQSALAEITPEDFTHPGLRLVKFVFCDNQPNENGQGIAEEDFDEIIKSGVGTPIKMRFFGNTAGGHIGSIPIGYIKNMYKEDDGNTKKLIADATLFADEYPDEIQYLQEAYDKGEAPGISWELKYNNSVIKDGIEWLKGLVTRAATFVRHPAYGNRTAILALASNKEISDEQLTEALQEILVEATTWSSSYITSLPDSSFACVDKSGRHYPYKDASGKVDLPHLRAALSRIGDSSNTQCGKEKLLKAAKSAGIGEAELLELMPKTLEQGGNNRMEEEIQKLRDQIATLETSVSEKDEQITELTTKVTGLETSIVEKDSALAEFTKKDLIASRTAALVEAGVTLPEDPDKLAAKQEYLAKLDEESFETYKTDLAEAIASASKKKDATASLPVRRPTALPRFDASASADEMPPTILGIRDKFKSISRVSASAESE